MKVHRVPLCFAAVPPSIAIKDLKKNFAFGSLLKIPHQNIPQIYENRAPI